MRDFRYLIFCSGLLMADLFLFRALSADAFVNRSLIYLCSRGTEPLFREYFRYHFHLHFSLLSVSLFSSRVSKDEHVLPLDFEVHTPACHVRYQDSLPQGFSDCIFFSRRVYIWSRRAESHFRTFQPLFETGVGRVRMQEAHFSIAISLHCITMVLRGCKYHWIASDTVVTPMRTCDNERLPENSQLQELHHSLSQAFVFHNSFTVTAEIYRASQYTPSPLSFFTLFSLFEMFCRIG